MASVFVTYYIPIGVYVKWDDVSSILPKRNFFYRRIIIILISTRDDSVYNQTVWLSSRRVSLYNEYYGYTNGPDAWRMTECLFDNNLQCIGLYKQMRERCLIELAQF